MSPTASPGRWRRGLAVLCLCLPALAWSDESADRQADLEALKRRIEILEKSVEGIETNRAAAERRRVEAERAVSATRRRLRDLNAQLAAVEQELAGIERERDAVGLSVAARQEELAQWLRRHYIHRGSEVAPILAARDPNQVARDLHYVERLGRARLELIASLQADLAQQARLAADAEARRTSLTRIRTTQQAESAKLERMLAERTRVVAGLKAELVRQRDEIDGLREDEEQLGKVLAALARQKAEREAARKAAEERRRAEEAARRAEIARRAAEAERIAREQRAAEAPPSAKVEEPSRASESRAESAREPVVGAVTRIPDASPTGLSFAQMQGRMRFPVRGELIGRFGAPRAEGGTRWRGVFIRAESGAEVVAVAGGEVVFADWLRGYGNLIIVDHGGDYMTIYGHNDALLADVGENVTAGRALASVGASGSVQESGLYFEIRHRGQPVDPLKWVRLD